MKRHKPKLDASLPLRNPQHESFARLRVLLVAPLEAMKRAEPPYKKPNAGNAARLDRYETISARVRWLAAHDSDMEMLQLRRARLRSLLESIALADRTKLFEEVDVPERNEDGSVVMGQDDQPLMRTIKRLRSFSELSADERLLIDGFEFDGEKEKVKTAERLAAIAQLRKLDGLDRPEKIAMTDTDGKSVGLVAPIVNLYGRPDYLDPAPIPATQGA